MEPKRYTLADRGFETYLGSVNGELREDKDGEWISKNDPVIASWKRSHEALMKLEEMRTAFINHVEPETVELSVVFDQFSSAKLVTALDLITAIEAATKGVGERQGY